MATFWDVAYRVGDEIMKALDDLIEESEERFEDGSNPAAAAGGGARAAGGRGGAGDTTTTGDDTTPATSASPLQSYSANPSADELIDESNFSVGAAGASSPPQHNARITSSRRAAEEEATTTAHHSMGHDDDDAGALASPSASPQASTPPRTTRIPKIRLSAMEHLKIQRFVDSALLQIAIVQLPSVDAVEELVSYYNGCDDLATKCSHSSSLTHLLVRTEDGTGLNDEEIHFNEVLIKALPKLFLQLNWVHPGQEQVQRIHAGASVMVPWSQVYALPKMLHPTAQPLSAPALRRWSVWIGHQLLSDSSKFAINYAVGLPMDAPVAPAHPNHRTIGKCITPTHWQLLLRGCGASMDHLHLLLDSSANKSYADNTFQMRLNGCDHPCLLLAKTASLDVVGCVIPQLPPKGQKVVVTDANPGMLMYFTFSPTYRTFVVDRADPSNFFVISHDGDGGIGVFAKCPQRVEGYDTTAATSPATSEPSLRQASTTSGGGGGGRRSHRRSQSKSSATDGEGDGSSSTNACNQLVHEFGVAFHIDPSLKKARIATIGTQSVPAPFGFNIATTHDEMVDLRSVWIFDLVKDKSAMPPRGGSAEEFVVVNREDARVDSPNSPAGGVGKPRGTRKSKAAGDSEEFDMCSTDL